MFLEFFSFRISSEFYKLSLSEESTFRSSVTCDLFQKSNCRKCKFSISPTYFKNKADRLLWPFYPILTLLRIVNNFFLNGKNTTVFWRFSPYPYRIVRHKLAFYMSWARLNNVSIFFFCIIHCQCNLICSLNFPESLSLFSNFYTKCLALLIFCIGWFSKLPRLFQIREHFSLLCLLLEYCFFDIPLYTILWATINWSLVFLLSICSFLLSICKPRLLKSTFLWQNNIF